MEQIVPYTRQVQPDYVDNLLPGYRFCPTDSEIIVYYLKRKIETGEHPECRLHEVYLYDHNPEELAERHRSCDGKWYFLTSRERKYPKGDRPNRRTRNSGFWKTTQKDSTVYHDVTRQVVGKKRSLAYYEDKDHKTPWLMHEYTMNDPNLPVKSGQHGNMKLTDWVLCKIYKKETNRSDTSNQAEEVLNTRNQEGEIREQNQPQDEPSPQRRRLSVNEGSSQPNEPVQIQEANDQDSGTNFQMVAHMQPMFNPNQQAIDNIYTRGRLTSPMGSAQLFPAQTLSVHQGVNYYHGSIAGQSRMYPSPCPITMQPTATFCGSGSKQPTVAAPHQVFEREEIQSSSFRNLTGKYQQNHSMSTTTNTFQLSNGASSFTSIEPHAHPAEPPAYTCPVTSRDVPMDACDHIFQQNQRMSTGKNSFEVSDGASSSTSIEQLADVAQPPAYTSLVTSRDVPLDDSDHIFRQNKSMSTTTNSFGFSDGASSSTSIEPLADAAQPPAYSSPLTSRDVRLDAADDFFQLDDLSTTISFVDEDLTIPFVDEDFWNCISFDELMSPPPWQVDP